MRVVKRSGQKVAVRFDALARRLKELAKDMDRDNVKVIDEVVQHVVGALYDEIPTHDIDDLLAEESIAMSTQHPHLATLAARVVASNIQKQAAKTFGEMLERIGDGLSLPRAPWVDDVIFSERDFLFDYFGLRTLQRSYLLRDDAGAIVETPQMLWLRVAMGIHGDDEARVRETYDALSLLKFTHATPTLFNAGTRRAQLASCFLLGVEDSIAGMYQCVADCAQISKWAGGIGLSLSDVRAAGSHISGTNGESSGILPFMKVLNACARHVNQAGKRNGSIACYLEPWHADIFAFLESKLPVGDEDSRARDLFPALWIPDLFMRKLVESIETTQIVDWCLFCPNEAPGLSDVYGEEFDSLYAKYEAEGRQRKKVPVKDVWNAILTSQMQSGVPYMLYKDTVNKRNAQKNLGILKNSNLCAEIVIKSGPRDTAVCNLASVALPQCVRDGAFDHDELDRLVRICVRNLNQVIDRTYYPTENARVNNQTHRPIGIGVQGLADVFMHLRLAWESEAVRELNFRIFETMYFAAVDESVEEAVRRGGPHGSWEGSPASHGILQFDMADGPLAYPLSRDWDALKAKIVRTGMANSTLLAPMPTASTSQILGNNEAIEPFTSNLYARRTLAGDFVCTNKWLVRHLGARWNDEVFRSLQASEGSAQDLPLDASARALFKTAYELPQRTLIDLAADRGVFVDQTQSLNLFVDAPGEGDRGATLTRRLTSMHIHAWKRGLKTGVYYTRTKAARQAKKITLKAQPSTSTRVECSGDACTMCSA